MSALSSRRAANTSPHIFKIKLEATLRKDGSALLKNCCDAPADNAAAEQGNIDLPESRHRESAIGADIFTLLRLKSKLSRMPYPTDRATAHR